MKKLLFVLPVVGLIITGVSLASDTGFTITISSSGIMSGVIMPMPGSDRDAHGCIGSAGYVWSGDANKCLRPWESATIMSGVIMPMPGSDRDEHGCIGSAGYVWSSSANKCLRPWENIGTGVIASGRQEIEANKHKGLEQRKEYKDAFHADYGYIRNYFTKLTDKTTRATREKTVNNAVNTILASKNQLNIDYRQSVKNKTPLSQSTIDTRIETMINTFYNSVITYVDASKKDGFDAFVAGKKALYKNLFTINQLTREKNQQVKKEVKTTIQTMKKDEKKATKMENKGAKTNTGSTK